MNKIAKYLLGVGVLAIMPLSASAATIPPASAALSCPTWVDPGETVSCTFKVQDPAETINGISAKYRFGEGLVYNSFTPLQEFNVNSNTGNGFAVGNTSAVFTSENIATIKLDIPASATKDSTYTFDMYDFSMTDMDFNDLYPDDDENYEISRTFKIIDLSFDDDLDIDDETNVIKLYLGTSANYLASKITTNGQGSLDEQISEFAGATIPLESIDDNENNISLKTGMQIIIVYYNENEIECYEVGSGYGCALATDRQYVYPIAIKGDVTGTGKVTMADVMKAATHILEGNTIIGNAYLEAADVTGDGNIKMNDVMKMANYVLEGGTL